MTVQTVIGNIQCSIVKPAKVRCVATVQNLCEWLLPTEFVAGQSCPESFIILLGAFPKFFQRFFVQSSLFFKAIRRGEQTIFLQNGFDVICGHKLLLCLVVVVLAYVSKRYRITALLTVSVTDTAQKHPYKSATIVC